MHTTLECVSLRAYQDVTTLPRSRQMIISQSVTSFPCRAERHTQPHTMWPQSRAGTPTIDQHNTHTQQVVPSVQSNSGELLRCEASSRVDCCQIGSYLYNLPSRQESLAVQVQPAQGLVRTEAWRAHQPRTVFSLTTGQPLFALASESTVITNDNRISDEPVGQGVAANPSAEHGVGSPRSVVEVWCWPSACLEG